MIEGRDNQIRTLQADLERLRHSIHRRESVGDEDDEDAVFLEGTTRITRMKDEIEHLRKEVAHWKRLVNEGSKQNPSQKLTAYCLIH
ncbi:unnamed protein product [Gongylonema pulchrum]|uniref:Uncharacterized protein n=1 Tax=Gongylonema pulchrum TaxID=637853 RepID=A0A183E123_9BILA|nr:unnamed protein product [Gongylonema pulchrum]